AALPCVTQISHNAALASNSTGIPCWALGCSGWTAGPGDDWREVADWPELVAALAPFERPFFTLGREPLQHLEEIPEHQFWTLRALDSYPGNERCDVIGARGPF
ncbi:precorrin-6A/cobalt-precorrin-6A reductase, partial [Pseudomonas viridiflava]|uniref:precorrin-6A/cobalt-precorrin-6A reductase n=1 Tax=Pseudomonas viridiflava TaxID=33069 RepID=UPI0019D2DDC5